MSQAFDILFIFDASPSFPGIISDSTAENLYVPFGMPIFSTSSLPIMHFTVTVPEETVQFGQNLSYPPFNCLPRSSLASFIFVPDAVSVNDTK